MNEPAKKYVPHTSSMLLVDTIVDHHDEGGTVETTFAEDSMFINEKGHVDPVVFIELLAQGFAALNGYTNHLKNISGKKGYLVGLKSMTFHDSMPITAGMKLSAKLEVDVRLDDFALVNGALYHESTLLMDGVIKLFIPETQ